MQNSFSETLSDIISRSNISKNEIVRRCDIDRSSFFKILNGTRVPTIDQFVRICRKLQLSPSDEKKLRISYSKMTLGEKKIRLRNLLTDFLWMLEDAEDIKALDITKPTLQSEYNETIVSGKQAVFELLKDTVLHEVWSEQEMHEVDLFLPLSADDFLEWTSSLLKSDIGSSFRIRHIIELPPFSTAMDPIVIEQLMRSLLCAAANFKSYTGYYYYANTSLDSHIGVFCSYSLITPDRVILLNERMDKAIIITNRKCCDEFRYQLMIARNNAYPLIKKMRYKDLLTNLSNPISYRYGGNVFADKQFKDNSIAFISPKIIMALRDTKVPLNQNSEDSVFAKQKLQLIKEIRKRLGSQIFLIDEKDIPSAREWCIALSGKDKLIFRRNGEEDCLIISEYGTVNTFYEFMSSLCESGYLIREDVASELLEGEPLKE